MQEQSLNEVFSSHIISKHQRSLNRERILEFFSSFVSEKNFNEWHLCLTRFLEIEYQNSLQEDVIKNALTFFNKNTKITIEGISHLKQEISHSIFTIFRRGLSWGNGESLSLDRPEKMAEFESVWHPEYQRYAEHIFNHLIQLPLFILGKNKGKEYITQTLTNRVTLLKNNGLTFFTQGFDATVRNAISHGNTNFELLILKYIDKKKDISLHPMEFAEKFDNLADTCHSILVALLLFLCENKKQIENNHLRNLPLGLRFIFIDSFCSHPGLELLSMIESRNSAADKQLNIVCKIKSKARWVQLYEGLFICWKASLFGGEEYSRYYISFDCDMPVLTSLFIDGNNLFNTIKLNKPLEESFSEIIDTSLLWYDSSKLEKKLYGWQSLFPIYLEATKREITKKWRDLDLKVLRSRYEIRGKENKSSESIRQVNAHVILHERGTITAELLHEIVTHAIKQIRKYRVRRTDLNGEKGIARKPDYVGVRFYSRSRRNRTLKSFDWKDEELVLIAEWISRSEKMQPFYTKEVDAVVGNIRIRYNPLLVNTQEKS